MRSAVCGFVVVAMFSIVGVMGCRETTKDATAYCRTGDAYREKGELDKAIADYTEAIRLEPKDATAYFARGEIGRASCRERVCSWV